MNCIPRTPSVVLFAVLEGSAETAFERVSKEYLCCEEEENASCSFVFALETWRVRLAVMKILEKKGVPKTILF